MRLLAQQKDIFNSFDSLSNSEEAFKNDFESLSPEKSELINNFCALSR